MSRAVFRILLAVLGVGSAATPCAADALYVASRAGHMVLKVAENLGVSVFARGYQTPGQLAFNTRDSRLYVPDAGGNLVQRVTLSGAFSTFATGLSGPTGLAIDGGGNVYVSNAGTVGSRANTISKITPGGSISTFATGLNGPGGMSFDSLGNLFVTTSDGTVAKVSAGGGVSTFASGLTAPTGIAVDALDNLFVANGSGVTRITPAGAATTFATGFTATPSMLTFDSAGGLFVTAGNGIDRVSAAGVVTKKYVTDLGTTSGIAAVLELWTWTGGVGNWSAAAKWNPASVPSASLAHVRIDGGNAAASAVTLDQNATAGTLDVSEGDSLSIAAGRKLTLGGPKTSTINGALNNAGTLAVTGGRTKLFGGGTHTGAFSVTGSTVLDFAGGTHAFAAGSTFAGNGFVYLSGGTADFAGPLVASGGPTVYLMGATVVAPSIRVSGGGTLYIAGGAISPCDVTLDGGNVHVFSIASPLVTTGIAIDNGQLDLSDRPLIVRGGDIAAVSALVRSGFQTGVGIASGTATNGQVLAAALVGQPGTVEGVSVDAGDVLVRLTIGGDADLDGRVGFGDLVRVAQNYDTSGKYWYEGDFTADGVVNFSDLVLVAQNYDTSLPSAAGPIPGAPTSFNADLARAFASVPEPSAVAGAAIVGVATINGRRRRQFERR